MPVRFYTRGMLLLRNLILGLVAAGLSCFSAKSTATQVEVRIPVWNVKNIVGQVSGYVNGQGITKRKRVRPQRNEYWLPSYEYYAPPPLKHYPPWLPYYPHPLYPPPTMPPTRPPTDPPTDPPTKPPTKPPTMPPTKPPTDPPPTKTPPWPTKPTEDTFRSDPSICILYPYLTACEGANETSDNGGLENMDGVKSPPKLSIVSKPHSLGSICSHFPQLCTKPDEAQFLQLADSNGKPWLLVAGLPEE